MKKALFLATVLAAALGALLGYRAGGFFSRADSTVQLAARIAHEDTTGTEERTLESDAFRGTGRPAAELYGEAAEVVRRFRIGSAFLGAFLGLAAGLKLLGRARIPKSATYFIDRDECVSCARCFLSCPRERLRLKKLAGGAPAQGENK
jgi:NAD-dependent dihydropyrimidine dehydrogenase PreA subunit